MTNLTEQWNKGKLPEGDYYIKRRNGDTLYDNIDSHGVWRNSIDEDIVEVLAKVPSYEEYQKLLSDQLAKNEGVEINAELEAENTKLKELLKECELWFTGIVGNMNDKNVGEHNRNIPIGNFEYAFKVFSQKISEVLGEE